MSACPDLLIEFNTFTILGRCARTGALGVVTATGEMAVGSRVPFVEDGVGGVDVAQGVGVELAAVRRAHDIADGSGPRLHRRR